ncbi:hypothetical protein BH09BAC1_BH09BAC1_15560 [soil metagenome]
MKKLCIILLMSVSAIAGFAQDIHFSQFYNSPLTLNPTLTGLADGKFRVGGIYRTQWSKVARPFRTASVAFDMPIQAGFADGDKLGVGLVLFHDQTGEYNFTTLTVNGSFAYHKVLDRENRHYLSLGVQVGFTQKRFDNSKGFFADQVDGTLTGGGTTAENISSNSIIHENLNVGLSYSGRLSEKTAIYIGGAMFNVTQPNESFMNRDDQRLPYRVSVNAGAEIGIGKGGFQLLPSVIYQTQAAASEVNAGLGLGYKFKSDFKVIVGAYYRVGDAVIPMVALGYKGFNVGVSFDINNSDLKQAASGNNALEFSLNYAMPWKKLPNQPSIFFAPKF